MRLAALLGLTFLTLAPAHAQTTPPEGPLDLQFTAANHRFAMFFQRPSITWTGRTAQLWIFMAMPESSNAGAGGWYQQTIDCTARTITASGVWPVGKTYVVRPALSGTEKPTAPITANSMDESISKVLCDGVDFQFDKPPATDLQTAWLQAQDLFKSLPTPN